MSRIERSTEKYSRAARRTLADREFDWDTGRELERKDAEIDRLRQLLAEAAPYVDRARIRNAPPLPSPSDSKEEA